jgi:anhydro-N-acetylmuramic acid kinase
MYSQQIKCKPQPPRPQQYQPLLFYNFIPSQSMVYRVLGLMSGSSLDGLDIADCVITEAGGQWTYSIEHAHCYEYTSAMQEALRHTAQLRIEDYLKLDADLGKFFAQSINAFIEAHELEHKIHLICSHGHTTLHRPALGYSAQIGCGATMAALTQLPVVNQLRAVDVALGGQGAPIVPIAEKFLFAKHTMLLNIGGIANISIHQQDAVIAYDVCAANRVLNAIVAQLGHAYDDKGAIAQSGNVDTNVLAQLNALAYFAQPYPKSLANEFGEQQVLPILQQSNLSEADQLCTMVEHIAIQVALSCNAHAQATEQHMLVTGGGALNDFLIQRIQAYCTPLNITVQVPDELTIQYKEALAMALIGVLRWREENNVLCSVTGASRNSINGALWQA